MNKYFLLGTLIPLLFAQTAISANLRFLKYSPVRYFTEQDWELARTAAKEALNQREIGDQVSWNNPDSGNSGGLMTIKVYEKDGETCKTLQITNRAGSLEGKALYSFCKQPDGTWKKATSNTN